MATDRVEIGCTPCEEDCAQTGSKDYDYTKLNKIECKAYIAALRKVYGDEPEGASLYTKSNPHDFGTYYEVAVRYDTNNEAATTYAWKLEAGLAKWADAGMHAPVLYGAHGGPVITPEDQWFYADTLKRLEGDKDGVQA